MAQKAVVKGDQLVVEAQEIPKPDGEEDCVVRLLRIGVCNTDLEILKGYMGFEGVLGHEGVGVVVDGPKHLLSKRVVPEINVACCDIHSCPTCAAGGTVARNHCPKRSVLGILKRDGLYAHYVRLPQRNLHFVPERISTKNAAFIEPLAAAFRVVEQCDITNVNKHDGRAVHVAVLGDGKLGLLVGEVLGREVAKKRQDGAISDESSVVLFGKHEDKMELLTQGSEAMALKVDEATKPEHQQRYTLAVDVTGRPSGLESARALLKPMSTLVLKSTCAETVPLNTAALVVEELNVIGSRCGPFGPAIDLLAKELDLTHHISAEYPIGRANEAVEHARKPEAMKVQLVADEE